MNIYTITQNCCIVTKTAYTIPETLKPPAVPWSSLPACFREISMAAPIFSSKFPGSTRKAACICSQKENTCGLSTKGTGACSSCGIRKSLHLLQKLALSGYFYEKGIYETVIDRMENYIVQIEILILGIIWVYRNMRKSLKNKYLFNWDFYNPGNINCQL